MFSERVRRLFINTGNLISCKEFRQKATQSPEEEVYESVKWVLNSCLEFNCCTVDDMETLQCIKPPTATKLPEEQRIDLKLTVKVFLQTYDVNCLKDAISKVMNCLQVTFIDSLILAVPSLPAATLQLIQPVWQALEVYVAEGSIVTIGVSDLDTGQLSELHSWAQVKPSVNQVNLESCCVMPQEMTEFAKANNIQLLTHNDPKDILPHGSLQSILEPIAPPADEWRSKWIVRYSVVVKCRGIMQNRGYLVYAAKESHAMNGPH